MTNQIINNRIDLSPCILWQYDKASNLKSIIATIETFLNGKCGEFWDAWTSIVFSLDSASAFGLDVWGTLLGLERPTGISDNLYRRLIKGRLYLIDANPSAYSLNRYLEIVFGTYVDAGVTKNKVVVLDNKDMSIDYHVPDAAQLSDEEKALIGLSTTVLHKEDDYGNVLIENDQYRTYDSSATYKSGDKVFYIATPGGDAKIYKCRSDSTTGHLPTETGYWDVFSNTVWFYYGSDASTGERTMVYSTPTTSIDVLSRDTKYHKMIFPYPTGVEKNTCETIASEIGLNENETIGQNLENMALDSVQVSGGAYEAV